MEDYVTIKEFHTAHTELRDSNMKLQEAVEKLAQGQEEILDTVNKFATHVEERFSETASKKDLAALELKLIDAMDGKVGNVRIDVRKTNDKTVELVKTLKRRKAITPADASRVLALQPFPQT